MSLFKPIYAVVQRDLIKFSRQKGRVLSSLSETSYLVSGNWCWF